MAQILNTLTMHIDLATWVYVYAPVAVEFSTIGPNGAAVYVIAPMSPSTSTNTTASGSVSIDAAVASTVTLTSKSAASVFIATPRKSREKHHKISKLCQVSCVDVC